jgi:hypothetical protein
VYFLGYRAKVGYFRVDANLEFAEKAPCLKDRGPNCYSSAFQLVADLELLGVDNFVDAKATISFGGRGRPVRDFHFQSSLKPLRC